MRHHALHGWSAVEIMVAVGIIALAGAISYPMIARAKESASQRNCLSNLAQIGIALNLYRAEYGGDGIAGDSFAMGLPLGTPEGFSAFVSRTGYEVWNCRNARSLTPTGRRPKTAYMSIYPADPSEPAWATFAEASRTYPEQVVLWVDVFHCQRDELLSPAFPKLVFGLRASGEAVKRRKTGYYTDQEWWQ